MLLLSVQLVIKVLHFLNDSLRLTKQQAVPHDDNVKSLAIPFGDNINQQALPSPSPDLVGKCKLVQFYHSK